MRRAPFAAAVLAALLVVAEAVLRLGFGLGNPPLYVASPAYEYVLAPNQDVVRFGHRITTNEVSMRSAPVRAGACPVVLFIGDSIINGGAPTDQGDLATTILEDSLQVRGYPRAQVLNASAGSWGPDNVAAYLREHGDFGADLLVAVFSSHDAADTMTHAPIVGVSPGLPDERPLSAVGEALTQYLWPELEVRLDFLSALLLRAARSSPAPGVPEPAPTAPPPPLNPGWAALADFAAARGIPLRVYLHAEQGELREGRYLPGADSIAAFLDRRQIPFWRGLDLLETRDLYRDYIHINEGGQRRLADVLLPELVSQLDRSGVACGA